MKTAIHAWCGAAGVALLLMSGCGEVDVLENEPTAENRQAENEQGGADIANDETMYDDAEKETSEDVDGDEADETLFDAAELAEVSKEEFINGLNEQMKKLDNQIEKMESQTDEIRDDVQRRWETTLKTLREERAELKEDYKDLKDAKQGLWEDFRATVMASWNKTRVALKKAESDLDRYKKQE